MTEATIEVHLLLRMLYTSLIAGVGVSVVFAFAVYGVIRSSDLRREQHSVRAASYAVFGCAALALTAVLVVFGLVLLARKS